MPLLLLSLACVGCSPEPEPEPEPDCGRCDDQLWAGASAVEITPAVELFEDLDGDGTWDEGEPFEDLDGDGVFDPVWMAGFDTGRQARGVHDPLWARTLVLELNEHRFVLVALDLVGYQGNRVAEVKDTLTQTRGVSPHQVVIASTHTHDGPDVIGMWGPSLFESGRDPELMSALHDHIVNGVGQALDSMAPARVALGAVEVDDVHGCQDLAECPEDLVRDGGGIGRPGRDPLIVDRQLLAMQVVADDGDAVIATLVEFSAHPEILWSDNQELSSDFPHFVREEVEAAGGGVAIYVSGALGGMSTPTVNSHGYDEVERFGRALGARVVDLMEDAQPEDIDTLRVAADIALFPIDAREIAELAATAGIIELPEDRLITTMEQCEERYGEYGCTEAEVAPCAELVRVFGTLQEKGCAPLMVQVVTLGDARFATVPGELVPELANGLPDDFAPYDPLESRPNAYFPQHEDDDPWEQHAAPYEVAQALRPAMGGEVNFIIGLANHEGGYFVPEGDFADVEPLSGGEGDHYEESVSLGKRSSTILVDRLVELMD